MPSVLDHARDLARDIRDRVYSVATSGRATVDVMGMTLTLDGASPRMRYVMSRGYESEDAVLASRILTPEDSVLEAGSSTGFLAMYCVKHVGVRSYTMVEANAAMHPIIHKNFELNGIPTAGLVHAAVTARDGQVEFGVNRNFWSSSTIPRPGARIVRVPGRSIPSLISELAITPTALIMDIEGGEVAIPIGDFGLFSKIIIETHRKLVGNDAIDRLFSGLRSLGFTEVAAIGGSYALERPR